MSGNNLDNLPRFYPKDREKWRNWLQENYNSSPGIWIIYYKKNSQKPTIEYDEAVEEALAFGWIDSKVKALDNERYMQLFTPRKENSTWSLINKKRIDKIIKKGLITPAGIEKVEIAKKNGSWSLLDDIENLVIPEDLEESFRNNPKAGENFKNLSFSTKKQILWWIKSAKRNETRINRIKLTIESLINNKSPFT
jgi:uncharacterized protein YdeI (YjbR/CyaY-like superfamily)